VTGTGRRLVTLLLVLGVVGAPAVALRAFCVGASCDAEPTAEREVPFCSLPEPVRELLAAGFREGRSPDALGVTASDALLRSGSADGAPWPSVGDGEHAATAPLAFVGPAIEGGELPAATLADVAPTLEPLLGFRRPFPTVRSGAAIAGVVRDGARSPLVVTIVWKRDDGRDPRWLATVVDDAGTTASGSAQVGSLPLDPAAVLTTIGTGGLPSEHGITGSIVRAPSGDAVEAWSRDAPTSVIATLGDDLDEATEGRARIGLVAAGPTDRGLIGGTWYLTTGDTDDDDVVIAPRDPASAVAQLLARGDYGADDTPDLLGVTVDARSGRALDQTRSLIGSVFAAVPDATVVVTSTGAVPVRAASIDAGAFAEAVDGAVAAPVVAAVAAGGVFVDQAVVTERNVSTQRVVEALASVLVSGSPALADTFPAFAVSFGRYC
jgi:hypothetical protein